MILAIATIIEYPEFALIDTASAASGDVVSGGETDLAMALAGLKRCQYGEPTTTSKRASQARL